MRKAESAAREARDAKTAANRAAQRELDDAEAARAAEELELLDGLHGSELDQLLSATGSEVESLRRLFRAAYGDAAAVELQRFRNRRAKGEPMRAAQRLPLLQALATADSPRRQRGPAVSVERCAGHLPKQPANEREVAV